MRSWLRIRMRSLPPLNTRHSTLPLKRQRWGLSCSIFHDNPQSELLILTERLGVEAEISERLSEISRKTMQRINFFRLDLFDHFQQVRKIGVITQRKGGNALVA